LKLFGSGRDSSSIGLLCFYELFLLIIFPPSGLLIWLAGASGLKTSYFLLIEFNGFRISFLLELAFIESNSSN